MKCFKCGGDLPTPPEEPPVGTWVKDRHGATHYRVNDGSHGWSPAPDGFYAGGNWDAMWQARGPLVECGPYGTNPQATTTPENVETSTVTDRQGSEGS